MHYVGVDLHKKSSWFYIIDEKGKRIDSKNIDNSICLLEKYLKQIPQPFTLAVESTYNWYFFVDLAEKYAQEVFLANPYELKAFAKRHKKTDKIDARLIAQILQRGFLPAVTIADKQTRELRELLRSRLSIISERKRYICRLKGLLDKLGFDSTGNFIVYTTLDIISQFDLTGFYAIVAHNYIDTIKYLNKKLLCLKNDIISAGKTDPDIQNLITIPGLSHFSASLIKTEIIDIFRFKTFNRLCAYAGLAPRVSSSAERTFHGPLNKNRRKNLQWILLECIFHYIKLVPEKEARYNKIKRRKGHNTAKVALARDMLKVIYHVLKEKREFCLDKKILKLS